jgi:hypothetical protein
MPKPIIFLAFANDKQDNARYLRNLSVERKGILEALLPLEKENTLEIVNISDTTLTDIANVFQDSRYRDRIVGFHYGGHADGYQLLLETFLTLPTVGGNPVANLGSGSHTNHQQGLTTVAEVVEGSGIVQLLADQKNLKFAFFNGCSTKAFAEALQNALPVIISTESSIADEVAKDLAIRFYKGLAENMTIQKAFQQALAYLTGNYGREFRGLYRKELTELPKTAPWTLTVNNLRLAEVRNWTLKLSEQASKEGELASDQVNQFLVEPVYEALAQQLPYLANIEEWANKDLRRIKLKILDLYPYLISVNLRKLFSNNDEMKSFSEARIRQIQYSYTAIGNFLLGVLLSELWEMRHNNAGFMLDMDTEAQIKEYLVNTPQSPEIESFTFAKKILIDMSFGGEMPFVHELLENLLPIMEDENSTWHRANENLKSLQHYTQFATGEARKIALEAEESLAILLKYLAFLGKYKLQIVKQIMLNKHRMREAKYQHNILQINIQNEQLSEDERKEDLIFTDTRSVILHKSAKAIPDKYLNLTPFVIDANSYKGAVNAQLFYYAGQYSPDRLHFQAVDNQQTSLEVSSQSEYYEVKAIFDAFIEECF